MTRDYYSGGCQICSKRTPEDLVPMEVLEPITSKTYRLDKVCSTCKETLEINPSRILFVFGRKCESCKIPFKLCASSRVKTVSYKGERYTVCEECKGIITEELASGVIEKIAKLNERIREETNRLNLMSEGVASKAERKNINRLTEERYQFATYHLSHE